LIRPLFVAAAFCILVWEAAGAQTTEIKIGYLRQGGARTAISLIDIPAPDDGVAGARLAIDDNNTTGSFLKQHFSVEEARLKDQDDPAVAIGTFADHGIKLVLADLPADALIKAADAGRARGLLLFDVGAIDDRLREKDCRANVVHTAPTRSMLADGLAQYLVWKQWRKWLLVVGSHDTDKLFADALRRAAKRFGGTIVQEKTFEDTGGARRTDSGLTQIQSQIPLFLQSAPEHDVVVAADESQVFATYLPYRTWLPRPVAGSAGLMPTSWDPSHDQWGANQLQNRFVAMFHRRMTARDMQAWMAARMIGEAATHQQANNAKQTLDFLKSPTFALAAFKGQKLTLRDWNLQLRQPILLSNGRVTVSVSPQPGFLHQFSELDTLGVDRPETQCRLDATKG
jgi:ABC transporter substrate binding protein (PQQ-dependent alcohol dehydrogenase system)